jgi:hypothetical protein
MTTATMATSTSTLPADYAERVYAGVLGKLIGVYLGRSVEGWTTIASPPSMERSTAIFTSPGACARRHRRRHLRHVYLLAVPPGPWERSQSHS